MEGGARPGGVHPRDYDKIVVKDGKGFNRGGLSPKARSYLDGLASGSYQARLELAEGNPGAMFPTCTCQWGNSRCNSKTHNHWLLRSVRRSDHCGETVYVHQDDPGAISDFGPICDHCRGQKGGVKPKRKKKSKKRKSKKPTKRKKKKKKQTKRKK